MTKSLVKRGHISVEREEKEKSNNPPESKWVCEIENENLINEH